MLLLGEIVSLLKFPFPSHVQVLLNFCFEVLRFVTFRLSEFRFSIWLGGSWFSVFSVSIRALESCSYFHYLFVHIFLVFWGQETKLSLISFEFGQQAFIKSCRICSNFYHSFPILSYSYILNVYSYCLYQCPSLLLFHFCKQFDVIHIHKVINLFLRFWKFLIPSALFRCIFE